MNQFGKVSRFEITAASSKSGRTFIKDSFFTSPFKIMKPFQKDDGGISVFQQTASPGILAGDRQEHNIIVEKAASLEIVSQSFEKIFKMEENELAERKICAKVGEGAALIYAPNPCIPFAKSNFHSSTKITLAKDSRLIYEDCICAGRVAGGEVFDFTRYKNMIEIWREGRLIFRENLFLEGSDGQTHPERKALLQGKTMFGDFTHCGSMLIFGYSKITSLEKLRSALGLEEKLLYTEEKAKSNPQKIQIEVTENEYGDFIIRCLSNRAESIQNAFGTLLQGMKKSILMTS